MKIPKTFGGRLRGARAMAELNLTELGEAVGEHSNTISQWEMNKRNPKGPQLVALCKKLDVSLDWLYGIEKKEKP